MASHAEQVQQAKDALVEAAMEFSDPPTVKAEWSQGDEVSALGAERLNRIEARANAYRALLAATCPQCGGAGRIGRWNTTPYMADPCPAKCDNGRKRDE